MRKLTSLLVLALVSAPVFAGGLFNDVPEPEVISLLGIGALALVVSRRNKK